MAIACLRLVTFLPERPLRNVPRLRSFMARSTLAPAALPYLAMPISPHEKAAVTFARRAAGACRSVP